MGRGSAPHTGERGEAAALAIELRKQGVNITPANPYLLRWLNDGYQPEQIQDALEIARASKPLPALMPKAWEIARHIAEEAAPLAVQGSKKAILGAMDLGPTKGIPYTWTVLTDIQGTEDTKEGLLSFAEKRKPSFKGR